ncbi:hypothetical protein Taro_031874 [Colocasia esculenta]|uniref:Uncharacterized protein n=1 Tax=Colocasia esculenta TaxID=4460 RepID=A0A843VPZ2_COLES|nr:hypothetical protein [Colocasia esculenta]
MHQFLRSAMTSVTAEDVNSRGQLGARTSMTIRQFLRSAMTSMTAEDVNSRGHLRARTSMTFDKFLRSAMTSMTVGQFSRSAMTSMTADVNSRGQLRAWTSMTVDPLILEVGDDLYDSFMTTERLSILEVRSDLMTSDGGKNLQIMSDVVFQFVESAEATSFRNTTFTFFTRARANMPSNHVGRRLSVRREFEQPRLGTRHPLSSHVSEQTCLQITSDVIFQFVECQSDLVQEHNAHVLLEARLVDVRSCSRPPDLTCKARRVGSAGRHSDAQVSR